MPFDTNFKFDLSRLKRKQPDLKSVKAPRFLFDGWSIRPLHELPSPYNTPTPEAEFNSGCRAVFYPRGAHNDSERSTFSIDVSYDQEECSWMFRCNAYRSYPTAAPGLYDEHASFESVVHAVELYLMRQFGNDIGDAYAYSTRPFTLGRILSILRNKDDETGVAGNVDA